MYDTNEKKFIMLNEILAKIQRRNQISLLKKHPNVSFKEITLGINDQFILHENLNKVTYITIKLFYKTKVPVKKQESLW